ncbi:CHAT domain-containing protein [Leptolyngbya ohadii]|uniref:CHAT domain-containing protein n=1 Tax=Leptolyngbya ohadii TaxID=1962290 RepID=UPI0015C60761|nr:CHAT domain-containing protein [Leptolyngbya ohadii]
MAIVFLKQSVNVRESIRGDIRGLDRALQQSYTDTIADEYRFLADLLINQGRILEAQQILDLLKLEELREFTRNARTIGSTDGIALNDAEKQILQDYGTLIAFGRKIYECEQTNCSELDRLLQQRRNLSEEYDRRIKTLIATVRDNRQRDDFFYDPRYLNETAREIVATPGTVLIYPFVQDDKLTLLWTASGEIVGSKTIPVSRQQLGETVVRFRALLQNPDLNNLRELQAVGKQLYDWLIQPLEAELQAKLAQQGQSMTHLVFAQDRILRYVPMAALFDGENYLVERYILSTILSAELTDMDDRLTPGTDRNPMLALGLSQSVAGLNPLPNVEEELDAIVRQASNDPRGIYPGQDFLNQDFTLPALSDNLRNSRIVHIATHGKFVAGQPEQSYLVMGNGEPLTIEQINSLGSDLRNVHLVVLSACETALGGPGADGIEVAGISSYFLAANRASAVMASLWLVNDASTSQLMQQFYQNLANGMTKADALRQAQLFLLNGNQPNPTGTDRTGNVTIGIRDIRTGLPPEVSSRLSHPYYWAPFILIGNGL